MKTRTLLAAGLGAVMSLALACGGGGSSSAGGGSGGGSNGGGSGGAGGGSGGGSGAACSLAISGAVTATLTSCNASGIYSSADGGSYQLAISSAGSTALADGGTAAVTVDLIGAGLGALQTGTWNNSTGASFGDTCVVDEKFSDSSEIAWEQSYDGTPGDTIGTFTLTTTSLGTSVTYSGSTYYTGMHGSLAITEIPFIDAGTVSVSGTF